VNRDSYGEELARAILTRAAAFPIWPKAVKLTLDELRSIRRFQGETTVMMKARGMDTLDAEGRSVLDDPFRNRLGHMDVIVVDGPIDLEDRFVFDG
jgi:hypothetical protein